MIPKALILSGYGINCEKETAEALALAGAVPEIVHINDLIDRRKDLGDFDILVFPGGFSYGDDTGAGNAFANKFRNNLWEDFLRFIGDDKLVIGICNGFQVLTALGVFALPSTEYGWVTSALISNTINRYECRWVNLKAQDSICVFTKGIDQTFLPVAHGEGRFQCSDKTLAKLKENRQIVFRYCDEEGAYAEQKYPINPNGALFDIAGICDMSGRILGMMPHPERAIHSINRPDYHLKKETARRKGEDVPDIVDSNLLVFKNAVRYIRSKKKDDKEGHANPEKKSEIREKSKEIRKSLSKEEIAKKSEKIISSLKSLEEYDDSHTLMCYVSIEGEVDTRNLVRSGVMSDDKRFLVPYIEDDMIKASIVDDFDDLKPGKFGVPEPSEKMNYDGKIDLIIVPGLAFDDSGSRIGFGKSYYDRFLKQHDGSLKVGLAFESQIVGMVPAEQHDVPVDIIITEERVIRCKNTDA